MAIRVRRGNEADFDANKMLPGEWAVSLDTKYVRMCFAPGVCLRMATYEGFESDMERVEAILEEVESIEAAIKAIQKDVNANVDITIEQKELAAEYAEQSKEYARQAKESADRASEVSDIQYATSDRAGIVAPQDIYVNPSNGHMELIASANTSELKNSFNGGLRFKEMVAVENEQTTTTGAQLFVYNNTSKTASGVTFTLHDDQTFDITGTSTASDGVFARGYNYTGTNVVLSLKAGTYYCSGLPQNIYLVLYKANTSSSEYVLANKNGTFTVDADTDFTSISIRWASANIQFNEKNVKIMINSGTEAKAWEPYTGGKPAPNPDYPQEIKSVDVREMKTHNEQLLDYEKLKKVVMVNGTAVFENNGITITATGADAYTGYSANSAPKIEVKKGDTITISWENDTDKSGFVYVFENAKTTTSASSNNRLSKSLTYTIKNEDTTFITFRFGVYNAGDTIEYKNIMINKGSEALPYKPFKESSVALSNLKLNGIGDVKDRLIRKDGVWQIERKIKSYTFTGNETGWNLSSTRIGSVWIDFYNKLGLPKAVAGASSFSSHFATVPTLNDYTKYGQALVETAGFNMWMKDGTVSGESEVKEFLANKNVTFTYVMETPTYEVLPLADQVALNSLLTFDGITYLDIESVLEPQFALEYGTSKVGGYTLKSLNTAEANELRIKAMESIANNLAEAVLQGEE